MPKQSGLLMHLVAIGLVAATAGCGPFGPRTQPAPIPTTTTVTPPPHPTPRPFPAQLVGVWSTDDQRLTFRADGTFDSEGQQSGHLTGVAVVDGNMISLQYQGEAPTLSVWRLNGGMLTIGSTTYLRDDQPGGLTLIGKWFNYNGDTQLLFREDGTFELDRGNETGVGTQGRYHLSGNQLAMQGSGQPVSIYVITFDGTTLKFYSLPDKVFRAEYVRIG